ncbi:hypothetical protein OL548_25945 [Lysinibacillus sp. MHQ-1]|nr:hypothetical protein OL548_25945 [Lysinibacillus sp. MHQ-1]
MGFLKTQKKSIDTYEQVHSILKSLLTYELKELPTRYEFWYRVAIRQEECRSLQAEHRAKNFDDLCSRTLSSKTI